MDVQDEAEELLVVLDDDDDDDVDIVDIVDEDRDSISDKRPISKDDRCSNCNRLVSLQNYKLSYCHHEVCRFCLERECLHVTLSYNRNRKLPSCSVCSTIISWRDLQMNMDTDSYVQLAISIFQNFQTSIASPSFTSKETSKQLAQTTSTSFSFGDEDDDAIHDSAESKLFKIHQQFQGLKALAAEPKHTKVKRRKTAVKSTAWSQGTGYGGTKTDKPATKQQEKAKERQDMLDSNLRSSFVNISKLLSELDILDSSQTPFSKTSGWICLQLLFAKSPLIMILSQLLQNDCLEDILKRSSLYSTALSLLQILINNQLFMSCLHPESRFMKELSKIPKSQLESNLKSPKKSKRKANDTGSDSTFDEIHVPKLGPLLQSICKQIKVFRRHLAKSSSTSSTIPAAKAEIDLLTSIEEIDEDFKKALVDLPFAMKSETTINLSDEDDDDDDMNAEDFAQNQIPENLSEEKLQELYKSALENQVFRLIKMDFETHSFLREIRASSKLQNPRRMKRIMREVSSLSASLPLNFNSSIFVRADESRPDVLKAAIIGPEDTPYANGFFVFDIFLPPEYPLQPPKVRFITTDGGRVRFNPNLYDSGKVCLSLLGTWQGPSWNPTNSTLLQVLLSIQSMILVEKPYYNEPGFESRESSASDTYNMGLKYETARVAILGALNHIPVEFGAALRSHFEIKTHTIKHQLEKWLTENRDMDKKRETSRKKFQQQKKLQQQQKQQQQQHHQDFFFSIAQTFNHFFEGPGTISLHNQHGPIHQISMVTAETFEHVIAQIIPRLDSFKVVEEIVLD